MLGIDVNYETMSSLREIPNEGVLNKNVLLIASPQPASDYVEFLNLHLNENDKCFIELFDVTGRKITVQKFNGFDFPIKINLSKVSSGIYSYRLSINGDYINNGIISVSKK